MTEDDSRTSIAVVCKDVNYKNNNCNVNVATDDLCGANNNDAYCPEGHKSYCNEQGSCVESLQMGIQSKFSANNMPKNCVIHETLNTEIAKHHVDIEQKFKEYQQTFDNDNQQTHSNDLGIYQLKKDEYNDTLQIYIAAIEGMRTAKTTLEYQTHYDEWKQVENYFSQKGCAPPVPPAPPATHTAPKIEDACAVAYKLGWKIGKDLALLVTESGDSYVDLLKQMKCVKEYIGVQSSQATTSEGEMSMLCLDKGRKEATRLIWVFQEIQCI